MGAGTIGTIVGTVIGAWLWVSFVAWSVRKMADVTRIQSLVWGSALVPVFAYVVSSLFVDASDSDPPLAFGVRYFIGALMLLPTRLYLAWRAEERARQEQAHKAAKTPVIPAATAL